MLHRSAFVALLLPAVLVAQTPDQNGDRAAIVWAQSVEVGTQDGRWLCYGVSADHVQVYFVDPATVKFDKKLDSWTCWMRQIDLKAKCEWKSRFAFRNDGDEAAPVSEAGYKFPGGEPIFQWTRTPKEMKWDQIIPDSSGEQLWRYIKANNVPQRTQKKK